MSRKVLRGGLGETIVVTRDEKPEAAPVRLTTALHGQAPQKWFRVVARRARGELALIAVGSTRQEVLEAARANAAEVPADTRTLLLEQWQGGLLKGCWVRCPAARNELPAMPARRPRRRIGRSVAPGR